MVDYEYAELFNNDSLDKQIHITASGGVDLGNDDLISESFQLIESLCSEEYLTFGAVEPRCVRFTVKYSAPKLLNKWLTITMDLQGAETPFSFGDYQVLSDKPSSDRTTREVTAYSHFHKILQNKYKSWYKAAWGDSNTMTIKQLRDSFFARLQQTHSWVVQETTTLVNDDMVIKKSKKIPRISGKDILNAICEINGVFGYIDRDNVFRYKTLADSSASTNIGSAYTISTEYEDYVTIAVDRVEIYAESGELLGDAGASAAASQNKYVIENNFMLKGLGTNADAQLIAHFLAQNVLSVMGNVTYVPFDADFKGNPCFEVGDRISFQSHGNTIYSYILSRTLKGIQSLRDNYTAESGDAVYPEDLSPMKSEISELKNSVGLLSDTTSGYGEPVDGNADDVYFKKNLKMVNLHPLSLAETYNIGYDIWRNKYTNPIDDPALNMKLDDIKWKSGGYSITVSGKTFNTLNPLRSAYEGSLLIKIPVTEAGRYKYHVKISYDSTDRQEPTARNDSLIGLAFMFDTSDFYFGPAPGNWSKASWGAGQLNVDMPMNTWQEYNGEFNVASGWATAGYIYLCFIRNGAMYNTSATVGTTGNIRLDLIDFYILKYDEEPQFEPYIDCAYVNIEDDWKRIDWLNGANTSVNSGLELNDEKQLSLSPSVVRAWIKQDPPQIAREFNQLCVRTTGTPYNSLSIVHSSDHVIENKSIAHNETNIYKVKCGGVVSSSSHNYVVYEITGMGYDPNHGANNYVNFAVNFGNNATFNTEQNRRACGVLFSTSSTISSELWTTLASAEPQTWIAGAGYNYYSFRRETRKIYGYGNIDVTTATLYMIVIMDDVTNSEEVIVSLSEFVLSNEKSGVIRDIYLSTSDGTWMKYVPISEDVKD